MGEQEKEKKFEVEKSKEMTADDLNKKLESEYGHQLVPVSERWGEINQTIEKFDVGERFVELNSDDLNIFRDGFITIGGDANSGKTSLVIDFCLDILKENSDICVLFFSLDESFRIIGKKLLHNFNNNHSEKGFGEYASRVFFFEDWVEMKNFDGIVDYVKSKTESRNIIIAIDYLQFWLAGYERHEMNDLVKQIKSKQKGLNFERSVQMDGGVDDVEKHRCILFCLSQLSRDKKGSFYNYRETSEIENISDVCMDISELVDESGNGLDIREITIKKNKLGMRRQTFETILNYDNWRFDKVVKKNKDETNNTEVDYSKVMG